MKTKFRLVYEKEYWPICYSVQEFDTLLGGRWYTIAQTITRSGAMRRLRQRYPKSVVVKEWEEEV